MCHDEGVGVEKEQVMNRKARTMKNSGVALGLVCVLVGMAACGGGGDSDEPATETTAVESSSSVLVKNQRLNECVSVMSGERPPPGVTVPRCIPSTTLKPRRP